MLRAGSATGRYMLIAHRYGLHDMTLGGRRRVCVEACSRALVSPSLPRRAFEKAICGTTTNGGAVAASHTMDRWDPRTAAASRD